MATSTRTQNRYDHRLRELVRSTQDISCAIQHGVPPSTARGWLKAPAAEVVTVDVLKMDANRLEQEVLQLRARIQKLIALPGVLLVAFKLSGYSLNRSRLPEGKSKRTLLFAIDKFRSTLPLRSLLRVIQLSHFRYHAWNRKQQCELDDSPSCPQTSPHQLTPEEVAAIRDLVTSDDFPHIPTGALAMFAQRMGKGIVRK